MKARHSSFRLRTCIRAQTVSCKAATERVRHGLVRSFGNPNDVTIGTFVPFAEAVHFIFDGRGNVSGSSSADYGGLIFSVVFQGTYTVSPNCTGSLTVDAGSSGIIHRDLVIVDGGNEVEFVSTDPGLVIAGSMRKQRTDGK